MKRAAALTILLSLAANALAGTATYPFSWYRNAAVSDFPVPLTLKEGVNGFTYAGFADAAHGSDLRAYAGDTPLPLEIETWNPTGKSIVWVKVPTLSSETVVTLSWGDATVEPVDAGGMWSDAAVVMHFGDTAGYNSAQGDTIPCIGTAPTGINAPIGSAPMFTRTGDYCITGTSASNYWPYATNAFTISFWLNTDRLTRANDQTYLFQWGHFATMSGVHQMAVLLNWDSDRQLRMYRNSHDGSSIGTFNVPTMSFPSDGAWHHIAYAYDGATCTAYMDGAVVGTQSFVAMDQAAWTGQYGGYFAVGGTRFIEHALYGAMDEVRFERVGRSAAWIKAAFETQNYGLSSGTIRFADYTGPALTDFPAYVHLDENMGVDPIVLYKALINGTAQVRDLRTGALLPVEIECYFNNAFDHALGLWVKMPTYSAEDGIVIGGTAPEGNAVGPDGVWDSDDYLLVFHMNPTNYLHDVKSKVRLIPNYKNNGGEKANGYPFAATGPTGPYMAYWSTTNAVQSVTPTIARAITNVYTVSWWMKEDADEFAAPKKETYVWTLLGTSLLKGAKYQQDGHGTGPNKMAIWSGVKTATLEIPDTGWHHYAYACDGTKTYCYRDGELQTSATGGRNFGFPTSISGQKIHLAGSSNASKDAFRGKFDEVRLETVCRDAAWIKATYQNQLAWKDGTPWQLAPHFADDVSLSSAGGGLTATVTLSCRTNATVTLFWGRSDWGTQSASVWPGLAELGLKSGGPVEGSASSLEPGMRYAVRLRAVNEFGTAWTKVHYVTIPRPVTRLVRKIPVTVNYDGGETLRDFPLCVRVPASNRLPADPAKVRVLDAAGNVLAWEAEAWDPAGESILWVRVPEVTGTTSLTLAFHDSFPADDGKWPAAEVWPESTYSAVWHFAASKRSGVITEDSAAHGMDVVENGLRAYVTNGVAGEAYHWPRPDSTSGNTRTSAAGSPFNDFRNGFTFSLWASIPDGADGAPLENAQFVKHELIERAGLPSDFYNQYVIRYEGYDSHTLDLFANNVGAKLFPGTATYVMPNGATYNSGAALGRLTGMVRPDEGWHNYVFTHDGMYLYAYLDGELQRKTFWPFVLNTIAQNYVTMTTFFGNNINRYNLAKGSMDEYRVERVGRSAAWIKACYDNLKAGSAFVTVGATREPGIVLSFR